MAIAYHLLAQETTYQTLGPDYFVHRHVEQATRRYVRLWEQLSHRVPLVPAATAG